ncbi:MAG: hypothetical protein R2751_09880 [Bacteroidales bacterium]
MEKVIRIVLFIVMVTCAVLLRICAFPSFENLNGMCIWGIYLFNVPIVYMLIKQVFDATAEHKYFSVAVITLGVIISILLDRNDPNTYLLLKMVMAIAGSILTFGTIALFGKYQSKAHEQ